MFKVKNVGIREMVDLMREDGSHRWLVDLGFEGVDHFQNRRSILRALRERYQKERVDAIVKKYGVKKKHHFEMTNKTDSIRVAREFRRIPTTVLREYSTIFRTIGNSDGNIAAQDLAGALKLKPEEARHLIDDVDIDGDGTLDFVEFVKVMTQLEKPVSEDGSGSDDDHDTTNSDIPQSVLRRYKAVFDSLDKNKKGIITPLDLSEIMGIDHQDAEAMICSTPRSVRSGKRGDAIDFQGFVRLLRDQEGKEKNRLENIAGDSDHSDHSDQNSDVDSETDLANRQQRVFETLLEQTGHADHEGVSVTAVVGWAEEMVKAKYTNADAIKFQFSFHEKMAELGSTISFNTFAEVLEEFPDLFEDV
eukprot:c6222_g1_i1.p1 GENE.c6222_g1_i1~~c6222_g1_i1.p1  ORF type:complete len:362 (+),score=67.89 c6222_g1_i1:309-1394(+)